MISNKNFSHSYLGPPFYLYLMSTWTENITSIVCITLIHLSHPSLVSPSSKYSSNGLWPIQWLFRMRQLSMCNQHIWRRKLPKRMMRQHHRVQTIIWVYRCYFLGVKVTKYPRSTTGRDTGMVNLFCERTLKMYFTQQCTRWPSLVDKQLR